MRKKLTNNILLKICSLIFAFCLWLIVMNVENPTTPQTFSNIAVQFVNTEVLTDQGLVYDVLDNTGVVKNITVYGPRDTVERLKSEDIIARADFNNLTNVNTIPIEFSTSRFESEISNIYGNISTVKLNVEKEKTIRLPLKVNAIGEPAEDYLLGNIVPDQNQITVKGAESVIDLIDKAVAEVDINNATSGITTYVDVRLYDEEGELVESDALTQKVTSVRVAVEILETKEVPIYYTVAGEPAAGYIATGEIESDIDTVRIAGTGNTLKNVAWVEIPAGVLDITDKSGNLVTTINIKDFLPGNVSLAERDFDGKINVTVYIGKTVTKIFRINQSQIRTLNVPEGYSATLQGIDSEFEIELVGLATDIYSINASNLTAYVDVKAVLEEIGRQAEEGVYSSILKFNLGENIVSGRDIPVNIVLEKMEE